MPRKKQLKSLEEVPREQKLAAYYNMLITKIRSEDSPESFACFFNIMEGVPPHKEGMRWIRKAYYAHSIGKGLLNECFRESGKTTVFSKYFALYRIGKEPHKTGMITRITDGKAKETVNAVKHIIENSPLWSAIFPQIVPDKARGWSEDGYFVKDESMDSKEWEVLRSRSPDYPSIVGYGTGSGAIVGSRINGFFVGDDVHDLTNTTSTRELNSIKRWYVETLYYCFVTGLWEIWNFTPWLYNDLYADLKANTDRYIHTHTPVMWPANEGDKDVVYWPPDPRIPYSGKWYRLAWSERWPIERIVDKYLAKTSSPDEEISFAFERQMLCDVEVTKGANLKAEWLHPFPADKIDDNWPVFFGIDYASTQDKIRDKSRDYFALAEVRAIPGGGLVLIGGHRAHFFKAEALEYAMTRWGYYRELLQLMGVESIGNGKEYYNDLVLLNDVYGRAPPLFEVRSFPNRRDVDGMVENWLSTRFKLSRIWVSDAPSPFIGHFKNEWLMFPNHEHNDCLAAVLMACLAAEGMMPSTTERVFKKPKQKSPYADLATVGRT